MSQFQDRLIRAARLDAQLYEEVEADTSAMGQAMGTVILSSVAAGLASYDVGGFSGLIGGAFAALFSWFIWALLTYLIGTRLLPEPATEADLGQLLRTIGFSSSPGIIRVVGIIPGLGWLASGVGSIWMLIAMVIAVRQALDYTSTLRAVGVCAIGWVIQAIIMAFSFSLFT